MATIDWRDDVDEVVAAVRLLASTDLASCGRRELDVLRGMSQRVRGFASAFDLLAARRDRELTSDALATLGVDGRDRSEGGGSADGTGGGHDDDISCPTGPSTLDGAPLDLSGFEGGRDRRPGRESQQDRARAEACSLMPAFESALAAGHVDSAHVDAVAAALATLDDAERVELAARADWLLDLARAEPPERFRRRVRDLARTISRDHGMRIAERQRAEAAVRRWTDARTGMGHTHVTLDPESNARLWAALDQRLAELRGREPNSGVSLARLEVDALIDLVTSSSALDLRSPEISVLVDLHTLRTGIFGAQSTCETTGGEPLSPATVRRLACDAEIVPVVLGGDGRPLDVGRARRLATRDQRRALSAMYATCAMPDCDVRFDRCRIHHVQPWIPVGRTDIENLVPVCDRHHHQVHEGGWRLTITADRVITLRRPDGSVAYHGDTRDRLPVERAVSEWTADPDASGWEPDDPESVRALTARIAARVGELRYLRRCRARSDSDHEPAEPGRPRRGP